MNKFRKPECAVLGARQLLGVKKTDSPPALSDCQQFLRRHLRLSPIAAIMVAIAGLALILAPENASFRFRPPGLTAVSPAEAVDISLFRLVRSRVVARFQKANRLNGSIETNRQTVDAELGRIRAHPLYIMIKERMTEHLQTKGFDRVTINATLDPKDPTLSSDAEITLHRFIHSLRAAFPAPNDKVAEFLDYHEGVFGSSTVQHVGAGHYDATLTLLIQLLFEFPDDLRPIVNAVKLLPRSSQDIEQEFRGRSLGVPATE